MITATTKDGKELGTLVEVAIEATRSCYWLYDILEDSGIKVKLSHPIRTRAIASAKVKKDKIDLTCPDNFLHFLN